MSTVKIIDFMGKRRIAVIVSGVLIVASILSLAVNGLKLGLDFTGGTAIEVEYEKPPVLASLRQILVEGGYPNAVVVNFGSDTEVMIRIQGEDQKIGNDVEALLRAQEGVDLTVKQNEFIGPQIGEELRDDGGLGMLFALAVVMMYVAFRFQFKFSIGAVSALIHDVIIVLGVFSILQLDFDLTVLAAVLAVIGYSLNDTIVVSDRIRENFRIERGEGPAEIVNISLSQTLGRTLVTSGTTLLVLFALFFLGGEMIHNFSTALIIGVGVGTYSSIYVAATILLLMNVSKEDLMPPKITEGEELDELP